MATNVLQPNGAVWARNWQGSAPTVQTQIMWIKKGYATAIGFGDLVTIGTGGNQGYITLAAFNTPPYAGIFMGVAPYYDSTLQQTWHGGLMGSWPTTANPSADVPCYVCNDPAAAFRMQVSGGPFAQSWVGNNINILTGTLGVVAATGLSTMVLDGASPATTSTFPFTVLGSAGVAGAFLGGPAGQDLVTVNPFIEVRFNFAQTMGQVALGI
jgi:hypothetical protein